MLLDFTNDKVSAEEVGKKVLVVDKVYYRYIEKIYEDYKRFIENDLLILVERYTDKHMEIQKDPFVSFITKGSLYESIRTELLVNFFRENKLGEINSFNYAQNADENDIKFSLKSQFNITFNSNVTTLKLFEACMKEIPSLDEVMKGIKGNILSRIKLEIMKQRKETPLTPEMKKTLTNIIPSFEFDNPLIPYAMYKLLVSEFKRKNFFMDYKEEERIYYALNTLILMHLDLEDIALITNMSVEDIQSIIDNKAKKLIRD